MTDEELQERIDALLADDPDAVNCGLEIADGVLTAHVVPPSDADANRSDLTERMDVPESQVNIVAFDGVCGLD